MPIEPVSITILITTALSGLAQLIQMYLDYHHAQEKGNNYFGGLQSNCCTTQDSHDVTPTTSINNIHNQPPDPEKWKNIKV